MNLIELGAQIGGVVAVLVVTGVGCAAALSAGVRQSLRRQPREAPTRSEVAAQRSMAAHGYRGTDQRFADAEPLHRRLGRERQERVRLERERFELARRSAHSPASQPRAQQAASPVASPLTSPGASPGAQSVALPDAARVAMPAAQPASPALTTPVATSLAVPEVVTRAPAAPPDETAAPLRARSDDREAAVRELAARMSSLPELAEDPPPVTDLRTGVAGPAPAAAGIEPAMREAVRGGPDARPAPSRDLVTVGAVERQPSLRLEAATATAKGQRARNQDDAWATSSTLLVADGVGGRPGGAEAAHAAVLAVKPTANVADVDPHQLLKATQQAHAAVLQQAMHRPALKGMGCTLEVAAIGVANGRTVLHGVHVGDSAVWYLSRDGAPRRLTRPQVDAAGLLQQWIGRPDGVEPWQWLCEPSAGDRVVVATDGLWADLPLERVESLLHGLQTHSPRNAAAMLVDIAVLAGGSDNVTVVVGDIVPR